MIERFSRQSHPRMIDTLVQRGTRAMGGYRGTISYPIRYSGTPTVVLGVFRGSVGMDPGTPAAFRTVPLQTVTIFSGSFTFRGSPSHGTLSWVAVGPVR